MITHIRGLVAIKPKGNEKAVYHVVTADFKGFVDVKGVREMLQKTFPELLVHDHIEIEYKLEVN